MAAELALILHAHLPYVRPAGSEVLEERWLHEAVVESYLPLLRVLERVTAAGVPVRVAISFSGPLLSMLSDPHLMARCRQHLAHLGRLADREAKRLAGSPFAPAAEFHRERLHELLRDLDRRRGDLLAGIADLAEAGVVELFTTAGTHPILPLLGSDQSRRAQIEAGIGEFSRLFGCRPAGLWLPECAYAPGIDHLLAAAGIRWSVADAPTLAAAYPSAEGPVGLTPGGVAVFGRDGWASRQIWEKEGGYPSDPLYREFHHDLGRELPLEQVAPWLVNGAWGDTGLKLYRITQGGLAGVGGKQPYDPTAALSRAREHGRHFASALAGRDGLVVAAFDAELFGHWWFEGPAFLEELLRALSETGVTVVTPSQWLAAHSALPVFQLPAGSWGEDGDFRFWVNRANDWLWPEIHAAEEQMADLAERQTLPLQVLNQAARELLLAQASDWPFILTQTGADFARERVERHLQRFHALVFGEALSALVAEEDAIFPGLDGRTLYRRRRPPPVRGALRILLLAWEFPPDHVGGLGRHVHDLGAALVLAGHQVWVITAAREGASPFAEKVLGMEVSRVARPPEEGNFLAWVYRLNQSMIREAERLVASGTRFDLVHSHDWLTGQAGIALKARWGVELVVTIHATERGRNGLIRDRLQEAVHAEEALLLTAADRVITVSLAMAREVYEFFWVQPLVIRNGVNLPPLVVRQSLRPAQPCFFLIGRLVPEKGMDVAIEALSCMAQRANLVIAGRGPMEEDLRRLAADRGVADCVHILGWISDPEREGWLQKAAAALVPSRYEPFGIVALEAMACQVPVIVSDTGGLAEIVTHGVNGLKVPPGDPQKLAALMDWVLQNPTRAERLAKAGRETAKREYAWETIVTETVRVYREEPLSQPLRERGSG